MKTATYTSKVGNARKGARIWIEGKRLLATGWKRGKSFDVVFSVGLVEIRPAKETNHTVAGYDDRPIIDIVGDKVVEALGNPGRATEIIITPRFIRIRKI